MYWIERNESGMYVAVVGVVASAMAVRAQSAGTQEHHWRRLRSAFDRARREAEAAVSHDPASARDSVRTSLGQPPYSCDLVGIALLLYSPATREIAAVEDDFWLDGLATLIAWKGRLPATIAIGADDCHWCRRSNMGKQRRGHDALERPQDRYV